MKVEEFEEQIKPEDYKIGYPRVSGNTERKKRLDLNLPESGYSFKGRSILSSLTKGKDNNNGSRRSAEAYPQGNATVDE